MTIGKEFFTERGARAHAEEEKLRTRRLDNHAQFKVWERNACERLAELCEHVHIPDDKVTQIDVALAEIGETPWDGGRMKLIRELTEKIKGSVSTTA